MPPPFKVYRNVNQVETLSPTIFNVVVYAVIRHWVMVVAPTEAGTEELGVLVQDLVVCFYAYNRIVLSPCSEML